MKLIFRLIAILFAAVFAGASGLDGREAGLDAVREAWSDAGRNAGLDIVPDACLEACRETSCDAGLAESRKAGLAGNRDAGLAGEAYLLQDVEEEDSRSRDDSGILPARCEVSAARPGGGAARTRNFSDGKRQCNCQKFAFCKAGRIVCLGRPGNFLMDGGGESRCGLITQRVTVILLRHLII